MVSFYGFRMFRREKNSTTRRVLIKHNDLSVLRKMTFIRTAVEQRDKLN